MRDMSYEGSIKEFLKLRMEQTITDMVDDLPKNQ